ncbi:putative signal peptidase complex subunit 1, partial [Mucuna pruriens]
MDWQGQKVAEQLMQIMLLAFAVIAFASGYVMSSFQMMILVYAGGVVLTTLLTVPNWPFFNRHPLTWLEPSEVEKHPKPLPSVPVTQKKKPNFDDIGMFDLDEGSCICSQLEDIRDLPDHARVYKMGQCDTDDSAGIPKLI